MHHYLQSYAAWYREEFLSGTTENIGGDTNMADKDGGVVLDISGLDYPKGGVIPAAVPTDKQEDEV